MPGVRFPRHLIDWPLLMVKAVQKYVEENPGSKRIRIISAKNRVWYHGPYDIEGENLPLFQERLKRRYDGTAQTAGFWEVNDHYWEWSARK